MKKNYILEFRMNDQFNYLTIISNNLKLVNFYTEKCTTQNDIFN